MSNLAAKHQAGSFYSVALIGSSGGGTATLGHTDPIELLTAIHRELLRVGDVKDDQGRRRVCVGISHAIFVSLCDGSGFDAIQKKHWLPGDECGDGAGPTAALYAVGFDHDAASAKPIRSSSTKRQCPFQVTRVDEGPLTIINGLAQQMDVALSRIIGQYHTAPKNKPISAIISLSSEPTIIHSASLDACCRLDGVDFPIVGSGGTSLAQIASLYDLRIVGNSGGSVASTSLTKARGWAMGLAKEWGMEYDSSSIGPAESEILVNGQGSGGSKPTATPTLKSILEAALPAFLFVCIALRLINLWYKNDDDDACLWNEQNCRKERASIDLIRYALQHIVLGTTCCILAATSRMSTSSSPSPDNASVDQSTLLMSASIAGVLASASATQSAFNSPPAPNHVSYGGGTALAGLVAGSFIPSVMTKVSNLCVTCTVTATGTNIICGGGVGLMVGVMMHLSGLAHGLGFVTGAIRSLLRWRKLVLPANDGTFQSSLFSVSRMPTYGLEKVIFPILRHSQKLWSAIISRLPTVLKEVPLVQTRDHEAFLPLPTGIGFLYGCFFVYGSKIGLYHRIFLPAILLEMDSPNAGEEASLLGAIDECTLVMVCAGICAANLVLPPSGVRAAAARRGKNAKSGGGHTSLAFQALRTNILFGDFIEAAYPSMERSMIINGSAYLAAGLSSEIILQRRVLSTAYLPLPLAIWISNDRWGMCIACLVACSVSFFGTLVANARQ